jgi:hypothetical protein
MIATFISEIKLSQTQRKEIFHEFDFKLNFYDLKPVKKRKIRNMVLCFKLKKICNVFSHKRNLKNKKFAN